MFFLQGVIFSPDAGFMPNYVKIAFFTGFAEFERLCEIAVSNVPGFKVGFQGIQ